MSTLLHEFHQSLGARFTSVNGAEIVADYGDALAEHAALRTTAGVLDLSSRSRICLVGEDRARGKRRKLCGGRTGNPSPA